MAVRPSMRTNRTGATFGSRTDVGCVRDHNEDSLVVAPPLFVVADGNEVSEAIPFPGNPVLDVAVLRAGGGGDFAVLHAERPVAEVYRADDSVLESARKTLPGF